MKFWKMNGAGNDFIVIDNRDGTVDAAQWPRIARTLCRAAPVPRRGRPDGGGAPGQRRRLPDAVLEF